MKLRTALLSSLLFSAACTAAGASDDAAALELGEASSALTLEVDPQLRMTATELDQKELSARTAGARPISISAFGSTSSPRFAAVFVTRSGPAWSIERGTGTAAFNSTVTSRTQAGFKVTRLSFEGTAENPVWAAIFEQTAASIPTPLPGLVSGDGSSTTHLQYWLKQAIDSQQIPTTLAIYGDAASPRYALVLEANPTRSAWTVGRMGFNNAGLWNGSGLNDTQADYLTRYAAHATGASRAAAVSVTGDARYVGMFRGDYLGSQTTKVGLSYDQLTYELAHQASLGRMPVQLEASGSAAAPTYAAIFAARDVPQARVFEAKGSGGAQDAALPGVDALLENFMTKNDVRNASLAVLWQNKLVYARAYNLTEPGTRVVAPTSYFRMGSLSKTVTALEIMKLAQEGRFGRGGLTTPVQSILNLTRYDGQPIDARFASITLRELLDHDYPSLSTAWARRCLKRDVTTSKTAADLLIAAGVPGVTLPLTTEQAVSVALSATDLVRAPDSNMSCYSNFAYTLLGMVVEKVRGTSFEEALWDDLLGPSAITRFRPAIQQMSSDEAVYRTPTLSTRESVMTPGAPLTSIAYGGDLNPQVGLASGAMTMAAPELARLMAVAGKGSNNPIFGDGAYLDTMFAEGYGFDGNATGIKGGDLAGAQAGLVWNRSGYSYVVLFARSGLSEASSDLDFYPRWEDLLWEVSVVGASSRADLFPAYGMPSL